MGKTAEAFDNFAMLDCIRDEAEILPLLRKLLEKRD